MSDDHTTEPEDSPPPAETPVAVQWMMQQVSAGQSAALPVSAFIPPGPALAPDVEESVLAARQQRIADALRGNGRLIEGLPAAAAESLLALGLHLAGRIVNETADLDDVAAEDILQPHIRAVRRLMMVTGQATGPARGDIAPAELLKQAAVALGDRYAPPGEEETLAFRERWRALFGQPVEQIAALRQFIDQLDTSRP